MSIRVQLPNAALIVVDVQEAVFDGREGELNNRGAEQTIGKLLGRWRKEGAPVFHIQYISPRKQSPFQQEAPGVSLRKSVELMSDEPLIVKNFESAFMETDLEHQLSELDVEVLVCVGFYTDQCLAATAKSANNLGFRVIVVSDATAAVGCSGYDNGKRYSGEDIHQIALGGLRRDGIEIIRSDNLL